MLDSGAYAWRRVDHAVGVTIALMSGADPRTGLRITRELTLRDGEASYDLSLRAENTADRPVSWSLWNVTQRRAGDPGDGGVWVGLDRGDLELVELVPGTGVPTAERSGDTAFVPHQDVVGKLGFPTAAGWLAHGAHGSTTSQAFRVERDRTYPDGGSRVEVWMEHPLDAPLVHLDGLQPTSRIVEIEVLGPRVELAPGESMELRITTGIGEGTEPVTAVSDAGHWGSPAPAGNGSAIGFFPYVTGSLQVERTGEELTLVNAGSPVAVSVRADLRGEPLRVCSDDGMTAWAAGILAMPDHDEGADR
ncbi:hypothetical protein [Microbacterium gubbeenense]|uniref:hypothetical protein n=2 Tax=Microbacterium gubbeenense TaxID=159896 RepID=UPI003F96EFE9